MALERQRILAGIPAIPRDIGAGDLAAEGGLDETAISFTKGCYLGQEVVARLKSMGRVRRRLMSVEAMEGAVPPVPAPLHVEERQVGELRSTASCGSGWVGLAMMNLVAFRPDAPVSLPGHAASVRVKGEV